nr:odorant receptor 40 [Pachyrhinus yasumatsui]
MAKLFALLLWISTLGTVTSTNISGVVANNNLLNFNRANNASLETHYLYQFWFPGNKLEHLVSVTVISSIFGYVAMVYNVMTNLIVVVLCIHSATHLSILQHRLRHYIPDDFKKEQMPEAIETLTGFVLRHRYLIAFTEHANKSCKNIIMMEFILTSIDVAAGALNIIKMNLSDIGWLSFYFPMLVIQIYCISWSANEVMAQSQAVANAAYESRWYLLNKEGKFLTHMIIQRAHERPLKMSIGPFGPMTMETFLMIMKAAYSYVSIMRK